MADASPLPLHKSVVVIGAGTMGSGIAEVAAGAGHRVYLRDTSAAALDRGLTQIRRSLDKRVERGRLDTASRDAVLARVVAATVETPLETVGLVIEVIVENLDAKVAVLGPLEAQLPADVIFATNTSSLSVTALAGRLACPERVVGMHFFNPATVLPLVEVVAGHVTSPEVVATIFATAKAWGKLPVVCRSTPGFIVNRVARPFYGEALRLLQERAATPATLDAVMRECGGFRMGPCELMDLIGHDVNFAVTRSVCEGFFDDPRYKPSLIQKDLVDAGWLGRKSGRGFFDYRPGAESPMPDTVAASTATTATTLCRVRVEGDLGPAHGLVELLRQDKLFKLEEAPGDDVLRLDGILVAASDGRTATERSMQLGEPVVLFDLALDYSNCKRIALAAPAQASAAQLATVVAMFTRLGKLVSVIDDVPGLVVTRTLAMLVNEAADAVRQGIASEADVDAAMQQGVNYPLGPLAWGRRIGFQRVATVLGHLARVYGEDRYRTSLWLQREVQSTSSGAMR